MKVLCGALTVIALFAASSSAAQDTPAAAIVGEAEEFFQAAQAEQRAEESRALYQKALLRYRQLTEQEGIANAAIFYNIGNIYFMMGDTARAILNYLRAARFAPHDPNLAQNLAFARSRTVDKIDERGAQGALRTLLFWHYDWPDAAKLKAAIVMWCLIWLLAAARLLAPYSVSRLWPAGVALVCALLVGSAVLRPEPPQGVIVADEVVARKGDGAAYEPSFEQPLHAGTEFNVVEQRSDWVLVELRNGIRCWLPGGSVEMV